MHDPPQEVDRRVASYEAAALFDEAFKRDGIISTRAEQGEFRWDGLPANEKQEMKLVFRLYLEAAELGDSRAQWNLAHMVSEGHGVDRDYAVSLKWARRSAEQGEATAQFNLLNWYRMGCFGAEKNSIEALKWGHLATEQGHPDSLTVVGSIHLEGGDITKAVSCFSESADMGSMTAQAFLGVVFNNGFGHLPADPEKALIYLKLASRQGYRNSKKTIKGAWCFQRRGSGY